MTNPGSCASSYVCKDLVVLHAKGMPVAVGALPTRESYRATAPRRGIMPS